MKAFGHLVGADDEYGLLIQVLHGSRETFGPQITKNNFSNSRFMGNKLS